MIRTPATGRRSDSAPTPQIVLNAATAVCLLAAVPVVLVSLSINGCRRRLPTRPVCKMDVPEKFRVRVLLADRITECDVAAPGPIRIIDSRKNERLRIDENATPVKITIASQALVVAGRIVGPNPVTIVPEYPNILHFNANQYRGILMLMLRDNGESFSVINIIPLEAYLAGVVGAEMPAYWEPQALQAQAIAARTYCLYIKRRFGARRSWDLLSSQAHQLYRGVNAESQPVWDAVEKTSGLVLVCQTQDGNEDLFPTYYSSTCGGHTENSRNVFGDSFEPLTGLPCPYCKYVAKPIFYFWPRVEFDEVELSRRLIDRYPSLSKLGQITDITVSRQSDYQKFSRVTSVKLAGTSGKSDYLRAEDFRLTIDPSGARIRSTSFRLKKQTGKWAFVSGRGFGHAVGMCQCGAQYMARTGKDAHEILSFYYPNSKIVSVYESEQF